MIKINPINIVYKIDTGYDTFSGGGLYYYDDNARGKIWKTLGDVRSHLTLIYKKHKMFRRYSEDAEIIKYELVEVDRIKLKDFMREF